MNIIKSAAVEKKNECVKFFSWLHTTLHFFLNVCTVLLAFSTKKHRNMINVAILSFNLTPTMMCRCYDTNTVLSVYGLISRGLIYSVTGCSLQAFPILPLSSLSGLSADSLLSSLFFSKQIASSITLRLEYLTQSLEDSPTLHLEKLSLTLCLGCFFWILPHIMLLYALSLQNCYNALHMRSHDLWFLSYSFFLPTTFSSL